MLFVCPVQSLKLAHVRDAVEKLLTNRREQYRRKKRRRTTKKP
jgi:hypothetical protein